MLTAREAAYMAISAFKKSRVWSDSALKDILIGADITDKDAALAENISMGTVENLTFLDYCISQFSNTPVKKLQHSVLTVMELSAYQIMFLDRIPPRAAVNEGVALVKKIAGERPAGFVNAVLRKVADNREALFTVDAEKSSDRLSIRYSHSKWFVEEIISRIGEEDTEKLLRENNTHADISFFINTLKTTRSDAITALADLGYECEEGWIFPECFRIGKSAGVYDTELFKNGSIYVQDEAAFSAVAAASLQPGMRVIDVCAAPGGKSVSAAIMLNGDGEVLSLDINAKKLKLIESNAARLGIDNIKTGVSDARVYYPEYDRAFDIVFADVPCSGFGVIRKKPEIRYKTDEETAPLCTVQAEILRNVSKYVKPGGTLIYSTCTLLKRENEDIVSAFLNDNEAFSTEDFTVGGGIASDGGILTLWPHINGTDGFFIAKLRRSK